MKLATFAKFALGTSASVLGLMVAVPVASAWSPSKVIVPCTGQAALVAAVNSANGAGGATINLAPGCHYLLTSSPDGSVNGLPVVMTRIGINGNGATIDGTNSFRDFEVDGPSGNLTLNNLTVTGGSASDTDADMSSQVGGGIANIGGTVTLNLSQVIGNTASLAGGGIASATFDPSSVAKLTLNLSRVTDNSQTVGPQDNGLGGGGIVNMLGTATLNASQVNDNTAQGFVGGGIANGDYMNFTGTTSFLTVNASQVNGNTAPNAGGGGIQNLLGRVTVNASQVNGNTSLNGGGISSGNGQGSAPPCSASVTLNWSQVNGNTAIAPVPQPGSMAGPPIAAGGIANGCNMVLNSTQVDGNVASFTSGAGIVNHGAMTLNRSEVNNNTAAGKGAVASGGGILNAVACGPEGPCAPNTGVLTLNHTQVNGNTAGGNGGGISNGLVLPQMTLPGGPVTLNHSQVTGNTAAHGGGIFNAGGTVMLSASNVTGNHPDNCEPPGTIAGCVG